MARFPRQAIREAVEGIRETPSVTKTEQLLAKGEVSPADPLIGRQQAAEIAQETFEAKPVELGRTVERNINLNRLDQSDEVNALMDVVSRQTENAGYQPKAFDELRGELDIDDEELYARLVGEKAKKRDYALTGAQLYRAREVMATSGMALRDMILDAAERAKMGNLDNLERLDLQRRMYEHVALQSAVQKESREAARALAMHREIARPFNTMQIDAMMNEMGGAKLLDEKLRNIARQIDPNASELQQLGQLNKALKENAFAKFLNQIVGYRTVQLLWSPKTHARNLIGNTITALSAPAERFAAAAVSRLRGRGTTEFGEAYEMLLGTMGSVRDAMRLARQTWNTGETRFGTTKFDDTRALTSPVDVEQYTDSALRKSWDYAYNATMAPGKALLAEDEFFKTLAFNGEMRAAAYRQGRSEGLTGQALAERINDLLDGPNQRKILAKVNADYAGEGVDTSVAFAGKLQQEEQIFYDLYTKSTQFAHYQTFTDPLRTNFAQSLGRVLQNPFAKLVVPFYRTPTNILTYATERSILAPVTRQWRDDWFAGGARRDLAEARLAMGAATGGLISMFVLNGSITGTGPANPELRNMYKADGWRPASMRIGDSWVTYQGFDPFSTQMAVIANVADMYRYATSDKQREHISIITMFAAAEAIKERSFMMGLSDMIESFEQVRRGTPARFFTTLPTSFIPGSGFLRAARQTFTDDARRMTRSTSWGQEAINEAMSVIPFWSESLPPQVDIFGKVQRYDEPYGPDIFSPFSFSVSGDYGSTTELSKNAVAVSRVRPSLRVGDFTIDTLAMPDDRGEGWKYYELQKLIGEEREKAVMQMIDTKEYKQAPPGPAEEDIYMTQGDLLNVALQEGRKNGTKKFKDRYEKELAQMIQTGQTEIPYWAPQPRETTERLRRQEGSTETNVGF